MIDIDFKFRPVGQGAFYSGVFKHSNGKQFSFVYDCGSHSSRQHINREITNFVKETSTKKIDILFISHFHDDHINKVSQLLNQTGGAKIAILPYLTPDELILAYTDVALSRGDSETLSFIQNPVDFLTERKVEHIIYIHPNNEPGSDDNDTPGEGIDIEKYNTDDFEFILSNQLQANSGFTEQNPLVSHYYDNGRFYIVDFWEFKLFNKPRDLATITTFVQEIKNLLGVTSFNLNDLADYISTHSTTFESDFNRIYSINFGFRQLINETSIVLHHSALDDILPYSKRPRRWMNNMHPGTLLTGDIIFNQHCFDEMKKKWINPKYRYDVGVFQIPHHGANNYLDGNLVSRYPNVQHWVINFGLGNTHKHPHQSIVDAILNNKLKGHIFCNTQANQFYYGCRII
jgi:hypothetical protein